MQPDRVRIDNGHNTGGYRLLPGALQYLVAGSADFKVVG